MTSDTTTPSTASASHVGEPSAFAIYRLPHTQECVLIVGSSRILDAAEASADASGYVIVPFRETDDVRPVIVTPQRVQRWSSSDAVPCGVYADIAKTVTQVAESLSGQHRSTRDEYAGDFAACLDAIDTGRAHKLVLSRSIDIETDTSRAVEWWIEATRRYPRMFISLFATPQTGVWLTASPEVLIQSDRDRWHTMALAGTMRYAEWESQGRWSDKNRREQQYVSDFVNSRLHTLGANVSIDGPYTARAGDLAHLRTDFFFDGRIDPWMVAQTLHPTPAVCGSPREKALELITATEHCAREYYTGFSGPWNIDGLTHLFVTLRCMRVCSDGVRVYAGGGLVHGSEVADEWSETEEKMKTMINILDASASNPRK